MSKSKDNDSARLTLKAPHKLELKKTVGLGQVRQSFSRGRTKPVTVEVKKKRTIVTGSTTAPVKTPKERSVSEAPPAVPAPPVVAESEATLASRPRGVMLKALTEGEKSRSRSCARWGPPPRQRRATPRG